MSENLSQKNKKIMSNKVKIIGSSILLLTIILIATGITIYPVVDTNTRFQQVKDGYNGDVFYGPGRQCLSKGGYANFIDRSEYQGLFLQKFDLFNPIYVIALGSDPSTGNNNRYTHDLIFIHFERVGIFSFKPIKTQPGTIYNKTWEEATKILQNNNLLENNPDSENISIFEPTPDEELKKIGEQYCNEQEILNQQQKAKEEFDKLPPAQKIQIIEETKQSILKNKEGWIQAEGEEYFNEQIKLIDDQIQKIKDENNLD